jgi:uncharacterized protein
MVNANGAVKREQRPGCVVASLDKPRQFARIESLGSKTERRRPRLPPGQRSAARMIDYAGEVARELGVKPQQVAKTIELLDGEATVPFIARYRKEATGNLDEVQIAQIRDRLRYLRQLDERKQTVLKTIEQLGRLTDELRDKIEQTRDANELEDLYLPFKPKRKTRASEAIAKGLEPLADLIWQQGTVDGDPDHAAAPFVNPEAGVPDLAAAWQGARDIVAERVAETAAVRSALRAFYLDTGVLISRVKPGQEKDGAKFRDYFSFSESIKTIPSHRALAVRRGETEGHLTSRIQVEREPALALVKRHVLRGDGSSLHAHLLAALEDGFDRLLAPSIEGQARNELRKFADREATAVFAKNLRRLLMAAPLGAKWVLGIDPGLRTGSKIVALDGKGDLLASTVIDPLHNPEKVKEAGRTVQHYCERYQVEAIAVGNGTGGREVETWLRGLDREALNDAPVLLVNEAGASVYSASETARLEFPDLDVTVRGAISIARRLQDPLAELVKIEPQSIGVGQYQHDVDQDQLTASLGEVVQSCVNAVGVDLNTASPQLLSYVSGLNAGQARSLVQYRAKHGRFRNRQELRHVPGVGPKTFEQAAGFLRIRDGDNPLDASAVHPERYELVAKIAAELGRDVASLVGNASDVGKIDAQRYVSEEVGLATLQDILAELARPGRDPRDKFEAVNFDPNVTQLDHLREGMLLEGVVTNVTDFGAFVDIGVHQDGLVHLSEMSWTYTEDASKRVSVGEHVKVKVIGVDRERKRISLSIKQTTEAPKRPVQPRPPQPPRPPQQPRPPQPPRGDGGERRPAPGRREDRPPREGDRRPQQRPGPQAGGRPPAKPKFDSPFAVLYMENGVIKKKEDPPKTKPDKKK